MQSAFSHATARGKCWPQTVGLSRKNVKREPGRGRQVDSIIDFSLVYFQYRLSSDLMRQLLSVLPVERGGRGWGVNGRKWSKDRCRSEKPESQSPEYSLAPIQGQSKSGYQ